MSPRLAVFAIALHMVSSSDSTAWTVERTSTGSITLVEKAKPPRAEVASFRITCSSEPRVIIENRSAYLSPDSTTIPYFVDNALPRRVRVQMRGAETTLESSEVIPLVKRLSDASELRIELVPDPKEQIVFDLAGLKALLRANHDACKNLL